MCRFNNIIIYYSSKIKISRHHSYPQLKKKLSNNFPLRKIKTMSSIKLLNIDSQAHSLSPLRFAAKRTNTHQDNLNPVVKEKQISFEVKTNSYNRIVEVKTKQEETICTTRKLPSPISLPIVTRIIKTETPSAKQCISINQPRPSSSILTNILFCNQY